MQTDKLQTDAAFTQYLNVVNRAIGQNKDKAPYKQLLTMGDKLLGDVDVDVAVYKDDPAHPHERFVMRWAGDTFDLVKHGKGEGDIRWNVPESHLREVIAHPDPYVKQPARLDLDWIGKRLGLA